MRCQMLAHVALLCAISAPALAQNTAPYDALTNDVSEVPNFMPEPVSGMARDFEGRLWAVNPYANTVQAYEGLIGRPVRIFDTGLDPVSVALYEPGQRYVLVACKGTHALFVHDHASGDVLDVVALESEPADIVVDDSTDTAFVSCQGDNKVAEIDLTTNTVTQYYDLPNGERPGPMVLDSQGRVIVAMTITGNQTGPVAPTVAVPFGLLTVIVNLTGGADQFADEDIYRIDPSTSTVEALIRGAGSLIFDIGLNPVTGDLWILSTDSLNDFADTEPELNGQFAINQLIIVDDGDLAAFSGTPIDANLDPDSIIVDLDLDGGSYSPTTSINQARFLDFYVSAPYAGFAIVGGPFVDRLLLLDSAGARDSVLQQPSTGSQAYSALTSELPGGGGHGIFVQNLGIMNIEAWAIGVSAPFHTYSLGLDPTPAQIRRGRDVFLDGSLSANARFSCASCHPGGMADQLGWPLTASPDPSLATPGPVTNPFDVKDVMVTQSLLSIADTFPHHWRGERDLVDFGKAWEGLLGDDEELTGTKLADVVAFMQSLRAPANPAQDVNRVLNDDLTVFADKLPPGSTHVPSAVNGQVLFQTVPNFNGNTCVECHTLETGTANNSFDEITFEAPPRAAQIEVAHLRQLQHKGQSETPFATLPGLVVNENGWGVTHNGAFTSVFDFIDLGFPDLTFEESLDISEFVHQFDQGISPAAHFAVHFAQPDTACNPSVDPDCKEGQIKDILISQAARGWIDAVAFGMYDDNTGGGAQYVRWLYDRRSRTFLPDDPGLAPVGWNKMVIDTAAGRADHVFLGVPLGSGAVFALDYDNDGVINGADNAERRPEFNTSGDVTDPLLSFAGVDYVSARVAKYFLRFSEDVTYTITYSTPGGATHTFSRDDYVEVDTAVLTFHEHIDECALSGTCAGVPMLPPLVFNVTIDLEDRAGNQALAIALPSFEPLPALRQQGHDDLLFVDSIGFSNESFVGGTYTADVDVRIVRDAQALAGTLSYKPAPEDSGVVLVFGVQSGGQGAFVQTAPTMLAPNQGRTDFDVVFMNQGAPALADYVLTLNPFVLAPPTDSDGRTTVTIEIPGLSAGDTVGVSVMGVGQETTFSPPPADPVYDLFSFGALVPLTLEDEMQAMVDL